MKARIPKGAGAPGNINAIMKQAQEMQENVAALQADLDQREYTATAADGMVSVTVTGKHQVKSLTIKPEMVDPEDMEMLEDRSPWPSTTPCGRWTRRPKRKWARSPAG